jgi:hypothetical protein
MLPTPPANTLRGGGKFFNANTRSRVSDRFRPSCAEGMQLLGALLF